MIHQYKSNGYNIVMDINSGAIHVVDDVVYDIIELYEGHEKSEIMDMLAPKYPKEDMEEAFEEIETLIKEESLFTEDIYKDYIIDFKKRKTVVKALCLHIAHDCILACCDFFSNSRKDNDIGIHRHTDGKDDTGDTRQCQCHIQTI